MVDGRINQTNIGSTISDTKVSGSVSSNTNIKAAINTASVSGKVSSLSITAILDGVLVTEVDPLFNNWLTGPPNVSEFTNDSGYLNSSSGILDIYVTKAGSDTTGDGSVGSPYLTIQHAINAIPIFLQYTTTLHIGAGIYAEKVSIAKKTSSNSSELDYSNLFFTVEGAKDDLLAETIASSGSTTTVKKNSAGWTVNAYQGKFLQITAGTGYYATVSSNYYPIISNTADTITIPKQAWTFNSTTKFKVVDLLTIIDAEGSYTENPIANNCDSNVYLIVRNIKAINSFTNIGSNTGSTTWVQGCDLTLSSIEYAGALANAGSYLIVDGCIFSGNYVYGAIYSDDRSSVLARYNWIKDNTTASNDHAAFDIGGGSRCKSLGNTITNCYRAFRVTGGSILESNSSIYDTITNCTLALYSENGSIVDAITTRGSGNTTIASALKDGSIVYDTRYLLGTTPYSSPVVGAIITYDGATYTSNGYILDAPADSKVYGRKDNDWEEIVAGSVAWDEITGTQTDISLSGFTNDLGNYGGFLTSISGEDLSTADNTTSAFITLGDIDWATNVPLNETDPVFSAWLLAPEFTTGIKLKNDSYRYGFGNVSLYVDSDIGNDSNDGSIGHPFLTINKAVLEAKKYKTYASVTIALTGTGEHELTAPIYETALATKLSIYSYTAGTTVQYTDGSAGITMFRFVNCPYEISLYGFILNCKSRGIDADNSYVSTANLTLNDYTQYGVWCHNGSKFYSYSGSTLTLNSSTGAGAYDLYIDNASGTFNGKIDMVNGYRGAYIVNKSNVYFADVDFNSRVASSIYGMYISDSTITSYGDNAFDGKGVCPYGIYAVNNSVINYLLYAKSHSFTGFIQGDIYLGAGCKIFNPIAGTWSYSGGAVTPVSASQASSIYSPNEMDTTIVWEDLTASEHIGYDQRYSNTSSGSGAPGSTPSKIGDIYVDISAKKMYVATGTSSSTDWEILN